MEAGQASTPKATKMETFTEIAAKAGERNSTLSLMPLGSSTIASLKSLVSGNLGTLPPSQKYMSNLKIFEKIWITQYLVHSKHVG